MSTRKPSAPSESQNRMTSTIASQVALASGPSAGCCQERVGWAKP